MYCSNLCRSRSAQERHKIRIINNHIDNNNIKNDLNENTTKNNIDVENINKYEFQFVVALQYFKELKDRLDYIESLINLLSTNFKK